MGSDSLQDEILKIKNIDKFESTLASFLNNKKRIILFSDSDPDGACSAVIMKETIEALGGKIYKVYFPDREKEGYGLSFKSLEYLKKYSPGLIIITDCGTTSVDEISKAKKIGFEVAVIDHHMPLDRIPKTILINPLQKGDNSIFKKIACAGLVYLVSKYILNKNSIQFDPEKFLELVMLATIADKIPIEGVNKKFIEEGIEALKITKRIGLKALKSKVRLRVYSIDKINYKIVQVLGASFQENHINQAYKLLVEKDYSKAEKIVDKLIDNLKIKSYEINRIIGEVEEAIKTKGVGNLIFEGGSDWKLIYLGPAASRLIEKYKVPVFLYHKMKEESVGAVRSIEQINSVDAMKKCSRFLKLYGGHPQASGFRLDNKNIYDFYICLKKYIKNKWKK